MPPFPYLRLAFRTARNRQGRAFIARRMRTLDGEHCSAQSTQRERGLPPKHHCLSKIGHFYFAATESESLALLLAGKSEPRSTNVRHLVVDVKLYLQGGSIESRHLSRP